MSVHKDLRPSDSDPIEDLMARCLQAPPQQHAAELERACREHPEHAAELRRRAALLGDLELLATGDAAQGLPEPLGDFRPLERLGTGGMGVVYRAEQMSLRREVAIKLVRPEFLFFTGARERFRREVEAVARLKHHGIVPVYAVGEERGLPYFAMELVEGCTLAEALATLSGRDPGGLGGQDLARAIAARTGTEPDPSPDSPFARSWLEVSLSIVRHVADALQHAHQRGILHRDVKPSNVMLTKGGRAMLLDFGLSSSDRDERLTRSGSLIGTLLYMPPEQVRGAELDARTDVYALGATLYECLTLCPPYQGTSAHAIQQLILGGRPRPPRELNRRVSPDAQVVCLTAMDPDPGRRYASAALLAEDLSNVLASRPILARPPGPLVLVSRWARRHPAWAVGALLGLLLLGGIPTALLLQQRSHNRELRRSLEREQSALRQRTESLEDADATLAYLGFLIGAARPDDAGGRELTVRDALDHAAQRIETLSDRPGIQARALLLIGDTWASQGRHEEALPILRRAFELAQATGQHPSDFSLLVMDRLASALESAGRREEAEALFRQALAGQLAREGPDRAAIGRAHNTLASLLIGTGRDVEAEELLRAALTIYEGSQAPPVDVASACSNLALALVRLHRPGEARPHAERALELQRSVLTPPHPSIAAALNALGLIFQAQGDLEAAEQAFSESLSMLEAIYAPDHDWLAVTRRNLLDVMEQAGRSEAALELCERSLSALEERGLADHPHAAELRGRIDGLVLRESAR